MDVAVSNRPKLRCDGVTDKARLIDTLRAIVGARHVLTDPTSTARFRTGIRFGNGPALAVVRPGSLLEQWRVLQVCAAANVIVIMQAANTGLTGGSTPDDDNYDRDIVIINTLRLAKIHLIDEGARLSAFPERHCINWNRWFGPLDGDRTR